MLPADRESMHHRVEPEVRIVQIGGRTKGELLEDLKSGGIQLNEHAKTLLKSDGFKTEETSRQLKIVVVSVRGLGLPHGATIEAIHKRVLERQLSLCPIELAAHFRLQYRDQPEGFIGHPVTQQKAPPSSITVACEPLDPDDNFPKGFYLRRIEGVLWLRGYCSNTEHIWSPDDRFAFSQK